MTGAILLAAGSSSRMGQSKQMLDIGGEKLLTRSVRAILEANIKESVVVLGANEQEHSKILQVFDTDVIVNVHWKDGMGSSIKAGLNHLTSKHQHITSVVVCVCDQPLLNSEVLSGLIKKYEATGKCIVASAYSGSVGVPVLFDRSFFKEIMLLPDDQGAKKLIQMNRDKLETVPFPGGAIDLDTMEDYKRFMKD